jgi:hypothetical protein
MCCRFRCGESPLLITSVQYADRQVTALSLEKVNAGQASHKMSLLIDVEMGRPIEAEVCKPSSREACS